MARPPGSALTVGLLFRTAMALGSRHDIVHGDLRYGYGEFVARVHHLGAALAAIGAGPGRTVGVLDWDTHRYLECFFAVPMLGAALHTVNVRLSPEHVLFTVNHAEDDIILAKAEFLPLLEQIWNRLEPGKLLVLLADPGETAATFLPVAGEYEAMLAAADPDFAFPEVDEEERATVFYTTGTTGRPKGVVFRHRQIVLHTLAVRAALAGGGPGGFDAASVYMPLTPMFHAHGWGIPYVATMLGVRQVYPGRYQAERLLDLILQEGVSFSHGVPTILHMILSAAEVRGVRLAGWTALIGGSALPLALCRRALAAGADVFSGYGLSETCPVLTLARPRPGADTAEFRCRAGWPVPMAQLRVVGPDGRDVAQDGVTQGEIVARAPWLAEAYLNDPEASRALWEGGWLHTGDIAVLGPDGGLTVTDRLKDIIKSGGEWVSSVWLEDLLLRHEAVAEAAVIGVPDPKWGERPLALLVLRAGHSIDPKQVAAHLRQYVAGGTLPPHTIPDRLAILEELPRTSVGKLDKRTLRERFAL